ncbi:MAG TPA: hypothetical protein V6D37_11790 [Candidatus Sericytochromatia bacterium]
MRSALIQRPMAIGKQRLPALHVLTLLHHPHRIFGTVGNTADPSPDAHTPAEFARQGHHVVGRAFSVSRNSFVRFPSMPITLIVSH